MKILVSLLAGLMVGSALAASPCELGPPRQGDHEAPSLEADFDGNRRIDRLWLLPAASQPEARGRAIDPWRRQQRPFDPAALALVIDRGRGGAGCLLIQNRRFFATPIWEEGGAPVQILPRLSAQARAWRKAARGWRGDGVLLGTEAGVDILLYWDGRQPRIAQRNEAP